jgi:preprotein translocase subunit SecG
MLAFTILIILILVTGVMMAMSILMQNPKGGGLSGAFGGAGSSFGTMLGVRHASDILSKATWWLAGLFVVLIFALNLFFLPTGEIQESAIQRAAEESPLSPLPQGQQGQVAPGGQPQQAPVQGQPAQPQPAQPQPGQAQPGQPAQ